MCDLSDAIPEGCEECGEDAITACEADWEDSVMNDEDHDCPEGTSASYLEQCQECECQNFDQHGHTEMLDIMDLDACGQAAQEREKSHFMFDPTLDTYAVLFPTMVKLSVSTIEMTRVDTRSIFIQLNA